LLAHFLAGFLFALDPIPKEFHIVRAEPARLAEDMRMPPQELLGDGLHHIAEIERALLLRHAGMKHDLQQQIAKLLAQVREIAARDRVRHLVGFLERIGRDRLEILLQIPGAAGAGRAQRRHDFDEPADVVGRFHCECPEFSEVYQQM